MHSDPSCFHPYLFLSSNLKCNSNARVCIDRCHSFKHKNCYENLIQIDDLKTQYRLKTMKDKDKMEELIEEIKKVYENKLIELEEAKQRAIFEIQKIFQTGRKEHLKTVRCDEVTMEIFENNRFDLITCEMVYKIRQFSKLESFNFSKKGLNVVQKFHKGYKQRITNKGKDLVLNDIYRKGKRFDDEEVMEDGLKREKDFQLDKKEKASKSDLQWVWFAYGTQENPIDVSN